LPTFAIAENISWVYRQYITHLSIEEMTQIIYDPEVQSSNFTRVFFENIRNIKSIYVVNFK